VAIGDVVVLRLPTPRVGMVDSHLRNNWAYIPL